MDRLHPARAGRAADRHHQAGRHWRADADERPGRRRARAGRRAAASWFSSAPTRRQLQHSSGSRWTAASRAACPSARRFRSRLVGSDGLMRKVTPRAAAAMLMASSASAQLPLPRASATGPPPQQQARRSQGVDALRADFLAKTGADTIFFGSDSARARRAGEDDARGAGALAAAASRSCRPDRRSWRYRRHARPRAGDGRAPRGRGSQLSRAARCSRGAAQRTTSWGKERPGSPRAVTVLVRKFRRRGADSRSR